MVIYLLKLYGIYSFVIISLIICLIYGQFITTNVQGILLGTLVLSIIATLFYVGILDILGHIFYIYGILSIFATPFLIKLFI
jgi:hypothetical protein